MSPAPVTARGHTINNSVTTMINCPIRPHRASPTGDPPNGLAELSRDIRQCGRSLRRQALLVLFFAPRDSRNGQDHPSPASEADDGHPRGSNIRFAPVLDI